jgi:hypothetical protein
VAIRKPQILSKKHLAAIPLAMDAPPGRELQLDHPDHQLSEAAAPTGTLVPDQAV